MTKSDPRVDKAISWALTLVAGIALSVGAYFFKAGVDSLDLLRREITQLRLTLVAMEARINYIEKRTTDRWTKHDMKKWADALQLGNPSLKAPKVD